MTKQKDFKKIKKILEEDLDSKRFAHTLGVEYTAACLAMKYDVNMEDAMLAGLLHDCAKYLSDEKLLSCCEKNHIPVEDIERINPSLLHAKVGALFASEKYGVTDEEILNAIRNHTTGRPAMSPLEKIIYIADYIEPGRKQADNLEEVRKLAFTDLDRALLRILHDILNYLETTGRSIDPMTRKTYEYYLKQTSK